MVDACGGGIVLRGRGFVNVIDRVLTPDLDRALYCGMVRLAVAASAILLAAASVEAQTGGSISSSGSRYGSYYGPPVDVALADIASGGGSYQKRAVRTRGELDALGFGYTYFRLRDEGAEVLIIPVPEIAEHLRHLRGRRVEVVGLVRVLPERCGDCSDPPLPTLPERQGHPEWPQVSVTIWRISDASRDEAGPKVKPLDTTLEALVSSPGKRDGQLVRVVGKFRGRNLYGDLPVKSQRSNSDWVIKDELWAVWVTGKKPKGSGWQVDPSAKRDTGRWIAVVGRPLTRDGITYLQAREVALTTAPTPNAEPSAAPPPPERPKVPPVVVFALPLDGDTEVATDSRFVVQFSEDMDEASFKDRVIVRYAGPIRPGDRAFVGLKLSYDGGKRALTVDPGDVLRPGRQVELLLLPGIAATHGLTLVPRAGRESEEAADVLRYRVGS